MKRLIFLIFVCLSFIANSQNKYWIFFTDKQGSVFNPYEYFDSKAIERRIKNDVSLYDSTDFPVNESYISIVACIVDSINIVTRWFNGVSVYADDEQIEIVRNFDFVKEIVPIVSYANTTSVEYDSIFSYTQNNLLRNEMTAFEANYFSDNNIDGKGVRIAIFDAGFPGADTIEAFEHIRNENRIIKTYDFHKKSENVYRFSSHGTNVFSCIAGKIGETKLGMATGAEFLLARTEITREIFVEEEYWLAAAEWADKNGADIINSSLGYTIPRYNQSEMDGEYTLVSRAAQMACDKGILVVNAIGNDNDNLWRVVGAPADVEDVLTVGGVDPINNLQINFSSVGPTADYRMKPNVCAAGEALVASPNGNFTNAFGTSFSTPLVTGFAACALQINPSLNNMQLKSEIEKSAHLYPYFDYAHGYGLPQASYFFDTTKIYNEPKFEIKRISDSLEISINDINDTIYSSNNYFYYHIRYQDGRISRYGVIEVFYEKFYIDISNYDETIIFMAWYNNYILEQKF